jgi:hypothetical protein
MGDGKTDVKFSILGKTELAMREEFGERCQKMNGIARHSSMELENTDSNVHIVLS